LAAPASEPRVRVAAVILIDERLVLVRQSRGGTPYHLLPGGGVTRGETIAEALRREGAEETGLVVRIVRPLFISDSLSPDGSRHLVNLTFLADVESGTLGSGADASILGIELVSPSDLKELDLRPPMGEQLASAWASGFDVPAVYLGPLWTDDAGT
jgi:ADP-ribose pyrophosphatase YjhB (NUDIX family)